MAGLVVHMSTLCLGRVKALDMLIFFNIKVFQYSSYHS